MQAYDSYTTSLAKRITSAVKHAVPATRVRAGYETVYGCVAAQVPANAVDDLLKVDGVVAVQKDSIERPQTDATPQFIGATDVWLSIAFMPARTSPSA